MEHQGLILSHRGWAPFLTIRTFAIHPANDHPNSILLSENPSYTENL